VNAAHADEALRTRRACYRQPIAVADHAVLLAFRSSAADRCLASWHRRLLPVEELSCDFSMSTRNPGAWPR